MYYFTHFASNLLLIGMIPLHDGTDGKVPQRSSSWGYGEGIYSGAVKWKYFNGPTTGSALMHLALKVNRKVYSDSGLHKPIQTGISGKQDQAFEAVVAILINRICAKHTEVMREVGYIQKSKHKKQCSVRLVLLKWHAL